MLDAQRVPENRLPNNPALTHAATTSLGLWSRLAPPLAAGTDSS